MNRINISILFVLCLTLLSFGEQKPKGTLYIIGGGERASEMKKFVELAGGKDSRIVIIPMAGDTPLEDLNIEIEKFKKLDCNNVGSVFCNRAEADADSNVAKLNGAKGVFFLGGDQSRLTASLQDSKVFKKIKTIFEEGGVVGGTSAGAAVMSEVMITGDELINKDTVSIFKTIQKGNVKTIRGFGFITKAIIDQHFVIRKRLNRLISAVLENPNLLGIGIDEATAIIVRPDETFEVSGARNVVIIDPNDVSNIKTTDEALFAAEGLKLHILKAGDKFDINKRSIIK
jgi:cyanophycinase